MRFVFSRLLHSLAVKLLCIYIGALLVTMASIAPVIGFSADQEAGVTAKVQLQKLTGTIGPSSRAVRRCSSARNR
jgi:hypothetical protein